jgi:hypothetical protein
MSEAFFTQPLYQFVWDYSITLTNRDEASIGDLYLQQYEVLQRVERMDPDCLLWLTICNHGDGGRNHIHGAYKGNLSARQVQGLMTGGISTVKAFHPSWTDYVAGQSLGGEYTIFHGENIYARPKKSKKNKRRN